MAEDGSSIFYRPYARATAPYYEPTPLNLGTSRGGALATIPTASTAVVPVAGSVPVGAVRGSDRYNYEVSSLSKYSTTQPRAEPPPQRIPLNIPSASRPPLEFAEPPAKLKLGLNIPPEAAAKAIDAVAENKVGGTAISLGVGLEKAIVSKLYDDRAKEIEQAVNKAQPNEGVGKALAGAYKALATGLISGMGVNDPEAQRELGEAFKHVPDIFNPTKWDKPDPSKDPAKIKPVLTPGEHSQTFPVNPLATNPLSLSYLVITGDELIGSTVVGHVNDRIAVSGQISGVRVDRTIYTVNPLVEFKQIFVTTLVNGQESTGQYAQYFDQFGVHYEIKVNLESGGIPQYELPPSEFGGSESPNDVILQKGFAAGMAPFLGLPTTSNGPTDAGSSPDEFANRLDRQIADQAGNQQVMANPSQLGIPELRFPAPTPNQPQIPNPVNQPVSRPQPQVKAAASKPVGKDGDGVFGSLPGWVFAAGAAASLVQPQTSVAPKPVPGTYPKTTPTVDPVTGQNPYPKPASDPDVERITENNPTPEACSPCMIGLGNQQKKTDEKVNNIGNLLQGLDLSILQVINTKLGDQVPGGLSGFLGRFKQSFDKLTEWLHLDRALNVLTFLMTVQNAYFLCDSLKIVTLQMIANGLNVIGIHDKDGAAIDLNKLFDNEIEGLLKNLLGTETLEGMKAEWKAFNRIYQAGANIINAVQNMVFSVIGALEIIGSWNAQIGNALKKYGVIGGNAFGWLNATPNFHNKFFTAVTNALNIVNNIDFISQTILSGRQAVDQISQQSEELTKGISESVGTKPPEHKPTAASESAAKAASSSPSPSDSDIRSI